MKLILHKKITGTVIDSVIRKNNKIQSHYQSSGIFGPNLNIAHYKNKKPRNCDNTDQLRLDS